jgi:hypothetical protein
MRPAGNTSVEKDVVKIFIFGNLEPVFAYAVLFVPSDRRGERFLLSKSR